ncbi:MAG: PAS domain S-box protein, partial [Victivallales bacterium]
MTEKKNAIKKASELQRQNLESSERRFRALVENLSEAIALLGPDGRFLYASPSASRINGYPTNEFMGRSAFEIIHPEDRAQVAQHFQRIQKTPGASTSLLFRLQHRDGSWRWIDAMAKNRLEDPEIGALVINYRDVTERKLDEEKLRESEEKYRVLFEGSPLGILVADIETKRFSYANPFICRKLGYSEKELLQLGIADIHPKNSLDLVISEFEAHYTRGEKTMSSALPCLRKNGTVFYADIASAEILVHGRRCGMGFFADVTERKKAEDALWESEERHRTILKTTMDGFWRADLQGRLLEVNETYCRMSGYGEQELLVMRISDLEAAEPPADIVAHMQRIMLQGEHRFESRHRRKDGSVFEVEVSVQYKQAEDGYMVAFLRDITERKQAETALWQSEERFRFLVEQLPDTVTYMADLNKESATTYISPQIEPILGYSPQEYLADKEIWLKRLHPEDRARVLAEVAECHRTGKALHTEYRMIRKDGRVIWFRDVADIIRDDGGKPLCLLGVNIDITESKEAEKLLRIQHDLFLKLSTVRDLPETLRLCLDAALRVSDLDCGGIYLTDTIGGVRLVQSHGLSDAFVEAACYYPNDAANTHVVMAGAPVYARHTDLEVSMTETERREALRALAVIPIRNEKRIIGCMNVASRTLDEVPVHCRVAMETIASSMGLFIGRAQVDEELVRAKAEWERTFDVVPDLIALIDRDHRIVRVNRAMAARMGSEPRQLVGSHCFEAVHGLSAPPDFCPHAKLLISGKEERAEVVEKRMNGIFDVTANPLCDEAGRIMGSVHIARDITERRLEEEKLRVSHDQLRALAARLETVQEEERTRLARDIHDVLAQELTRLKIELVRLQRQLLK